MTVVAVVLPILLSFTESLTQGHPYDGANPYAIVMLVVWYMGEVLNQRTGKTISDIWCQNHCFPSNIQ